MTTVDRSWSALLDPGKAADWFDRDPLPPFAPSDSAQRTATAWWMAELSRLSYRSDDHPPSRQELLARVGFAECATFDVGSVHGFAAAGHGRTAVVFRGTADPRDWITNLDLFPVSWPRGGRVHRGFRDAFDGARAVLDQIVEDARSPPIFTGHSLGGALATLAASAYSTQACFTFGAPRVGDAAFGATLAAANVLRVVNKRDIVPSVPPAGPPARFEHTGTLWHLDDTGRVLEDGAPRDRSNDGARPERSLEHAPGPARDLRDPVPELADHAPVNYVAGLEVASP